MIAIILSAKIEKRRHEIAGINFLLPVEWVYQLYINTEGFATQKSSYTHQEITKKNPKKSQKNPKITKNVKNSF